MRFDGHVSITQEALDILTNRAKRKDMLWPVSKKKDSEESTAWEHWKGVLGYVTTESGLPELVAGVSDISNVHSHKVQSLQRLHFMRATEESELTAYRNGVAFIIDEMETWIRALTESARERDARQAHLKWMRGNLGELGFVLSKNSLVDAHLAKALHCLQDSFSPAHVLRSDMDGNLLLGTTKKKNVPPACFGSAPPIRRIFDYSSPHDQSDSAAKDEHDDRDYYSGSLAYAAANAAAYASADLIQMGLNAIASRSSNPTAWTAFKANWLTHKVLDDSSRKNAGPADIDKLLQRSCSPAKMACGRCTSI